MRDPFADLSPEEKLAHLQREAQSGWTAQDLMANTAFQAAVAAVQSERQLEILNSRVDDWKCRDHAYLQLAALDGVVTALSEMVEGGQRAQEDLQIHRESGYLEERKL